MKFNLKKILAEHKLTAAGLVDLDNAKKIGMFAGVDALIFGTIIPKGSNVNLTVKIITTDTAEIVGAARAQFKSEEAVQQLAAKPTTANGDGGLIETKSQPTITKTLSDLRIDLESLKVVDNSDYLITMTLVNSNAKKSIWVAIRSDVSTMLTAILTDANGSSYRGRTDNVFGVSAANLLYSGEFKATEIKPGESLPCSVKLTAHRDRPATAGQCNLQMEFLISHSSTGKYAASGDAKSLQVKMEAE